MIHTQSKKKEVSKFLDELKEILYNPNFNIDTDFILIRKQKQDDIEHSTPYTLIDLDYDVEDVVERLKELSIQEYSETIIDSKDVNPPLLYIFGKVINRKSVYIKLKIKDNQGKYILCVSFHYARGKMHFSYT